MKRIGHKYSAMAILTAFCMVLSSCSVDKDQLSDGLGDLRDSITDEEPEETAAPVSAQETSGSETDATETVAEATPTPSPEPTATPIPTATPTPIPSPERVDFSEFTQIDLTEEVNVNSESFGESYVTDENVLVASFTGERIAVDTGSDNVSLAINLILDGFYSEAEGLYSRYTSEGLAELSITGNSTIQQTEDDDDDEDDDEITTTGSYAPYEVAVDYAYSDNGRVLSVIMEYSVVREGNAVAGSTEYASFDMLTGQYVTIASVASDYNGLVGALANTLAHSDEEEEIDSSDCTVTFIACQTPGAQTATAEIYGTINGQPAHTTVDMNNYAQYLNRYGRTVYGVE